MPVNNHRNTWTVDFRINGKRYRKSFPSIKTKEEAEQMELDMRAAVLGEHVGWLPIAEKVRAKSAAVGAMSELLVCSDLLGKGFDVYRAIAVTSAFDLVAAKDGILCRIEVKTAYRRGTKLKCNMRPHQRAVHDVAAYVILAEGKIVYEPDLTDWF